MTVGSSQITSLINDMVPQLEVSSVSRDRSLIDFIDANTPSATAIGDSYDWHYNPTGNTSATSFAEGDATLVNVPQTRVPATIPWKNHRVTHRFYMSALEDAMDVWQGLGTLFEQEMQADFEDLITDMNTAAYGSGSGNDLNGLAYWIVGSGTVGGVSITTYSGWAASVTGSVGALAEADVQSTLATLFAAGKRARIGVILGNKTVVNILGNLLDTSLVPYAQVNEGANTSLNALGGFTGVYYEGIPVIAMPSYTAQRLDFLDLSTWRWVTKRPFTTAPFQPGDADDIYSSTTWRGNLVCLAPFKNGALTGITS